MKKLFWGIGALFILAAGEGLGAQDGNSGFSPFVSELRAEIRNNLVRLTWTDSRDAWGPVYVFRSARPFSGAVPSNIKPVELAYGSRSFIDETDGLETIYYFIAASDAQGQRYDIFIPQTNITMVSFSSAKKDGPPPAPEPAFGAGADDHAFEPGISGITAMPDGEKVIITYHSDFHQNAALYRSVHPIRQTQDLLNAVIVQASVSSPFVDYPAPGMTWFYAVIYEDDITGGKVGIYPGRNATIQGIGITGGQAAARSIRSMPLPSMTVHNAAPVSDYFWSIPEPVPLRAETVKALESEPGIPLTPPPQKRPRVFARDLQPPAGGEESALMRIVQDIFARQEWDAARNELLYYLALPRSPETEVRARFYLGQTWYFTGRDREALAEFLLVQSLHAIEANEWISATLAAMIQP
jgi:hypothetical protein